MVAAVRYGYEYLKDGELSHEAQNVINIQKGAVNFAKDFKDSKVSDYINSDVKTLFKYMYTTGTNPNMQDVKCLEILFSLTMAVRIILQGLRKYYLMYLIPRNV